SAGGGFRSGSRAARDDGGSGMSQGQSPAPGMDPTPDAPTLKKPRRPPTLYGSIRQLLLGGLIGSLFLGQAFGGFGLIEIAILSGLIMLAFRALAKHDAPAAQYGGAGGLARVLGAPGTSRPAATGNGDREAVERAIEQVRGTDPSFDIARFAATVEAIFRRVQDAWSARDMSRAADVLSVEMRDRLGHECARLRALGRLNRVEGITRLRAAITEARQDRAWDRITVHIVANLVDYTTDEGGLKVIEGNPFEPVRFQERWEFLRPSGPHPWRVSAID